MPSNWKQYYRIYIVARYESAKEYDEIPIDYHSEKIIIQELEHLWKGYMKFRKGVPPKRFILYSWNFPCTDCIDAIIISACIKTAAIQGNKHDSGIFTVLEGGPIRVFTIMG